MDRLRNSFVHCQISQSVSPYLRYSSFVKFLLVEPAFIESAACPKILLFGNLIRLHGRAI